MPYETEHDERHGGGAFLVGLLLGAAVGAGLALLFAPKRGSELREELASKARKAREQATESYHQTTEKVSHLVDKGREAYEKARGVTTRTKADIKQNVNELVGTGASPDRQA